MLRTQEALRGHPPLCPWCERDALAARLAEAEQEYQDARIVRKLLEARLAEVTEDRDLTAMRADGNEEMLRDTDERLAEAESEIKRANLVYQRGAFVLAELLQADGGAIFDLRALIVVSLYGIIVS